MSIRLPAGVRIDGDSVGGRYVSVDTVPVVVDVVSDEASLERLLEWATRELDRAATQHERLEAKFDDAPERYAVRRADAEDRHIFWQETVDDIIQKLLRPKEDEGGGVDVPPEEYDVDAVEWEFGVEYLAAGGPASNVDINIRLRRTDGLPFGADEALDVMNALKSNLSQGMNNPVPRGYHFAGINWRSPHKGSRRWKDGTKRDLEGFRTILDTAATASAWRLGAVDK